MAQDTLRVLVVDDEKIVRDFFKRLLSFMGIEVSEAESGADALELARKCPFDLYFIDVRMPQMNGLDTYRAIRQLQPQAMAVMMTGYAVEELLVQAQKEGAFCHIHKPFDISQIKEVIAKIREEGAVKGGLTALAIDDDQGVLDFLSNFLKNQNAVCRVASNKDEALELLRKEKFDLVFLDLILKDTNGMELYSQIKDTAPETPVILMSGYPNKVEEAKEKMSIAGCLYKPFEVQEVMAFIEMAKARKHA